MAPLRGNATPTLYPSSRSTFSRSAVYSTAISSIDLIKCRDTGRKVIVHGTEDIFKAPRIDSLRKQAAYIRTRVSFLLCLAPVRRPSYKFVADARKKNALFIRTLVDDVLRGLFRTSPHFTELSKLPSCLFSWIFIPRNKIRLVTVRGAGSNVVTSLRSTENRSRYDVRNVVFFSSFLFFPRGEVIRARVREKRNTRRRE